MGGYYGLAAVIGVAVFLLAGRCDASCKGLDGHPGEAGIPGRDGLPGMKGQKGEPAVMVGGPLDPFVLQRLRGERGSPGLQGPVGLKGFRGALGKAGPHGEPGPRGRAGKNIGAGQGSSNQEIQYSAFSVIRNDSSYPAVRQKVTFQNIVVNKPGDFNTTTNSFVCRVPGVYYFTFHSVAKATMCLGLVSDALESKLVFCDYTRASLDQVLSGGAVVQLRAGDKVWLESVEGEMNYDKSDSREKQIIFNGFLLFSNPQ